MTHKRCRVCDKIGHKPDMDKVLWSNGDFYYPYWAHPECLKDAKCKVVRPKKKVWKNF